MLETDLGLDIDQARDISSPDFTFQTLHTELRESVLYFPFHTLTLDEGTYWQSWSKSDHGYKIQYFDLATFWLSADGRLIRCLPHPNTPVNTLQHLLLDQVLPYAITLRGEIVFHAGAVVSGDQAVVFLGTTGNGKSTLTLSLCAAGFPLLTDDSLLMRMDDQQVWATGSYPGLRLWSDSVDAVAPAQPWTRVAHYNEKRRITPTAQGMTFASAPVRVGKIYVLDRVDSPRAAVHIETFAPNERFIHLMRHSFRLDITDRTRMQREFATLTQLAARVPVYRLRYPRRYDFLPQVRQAISEHLENV